MQVEVHILQVLKHAASALRVHELPAESSHRTANEIAAAVFGTSYGRLQVKQVP